MKRALTAGLIATTALCCAAGVGEAQDTPKGNKGLSTAKSEFVDLGNEIEGMAGRELRMRLLKIEPGGHIGIHSHKDRPSVVYFLQGTDTVTQGDGSAKTFHAGDMTAATKDTTHWHQNNGKDDVLFIAVDVFHPAK